jgi:hypothetical protein
MKSNALFRRQTRQIRPGTSGEGYSADAAVDSLHDLFEAEEESDRDSYSTSVWCGASEDNVMRLRCRYISDPKYRNEA